MHRPLHWGQQVQWPCRLLPGLGHVTGLQRLLPWPALTRWHALCSVAK